jgi:hypothetical protein
MLVNVLLKMCLTKYVPPLTTISAQRISTPFDVVGGDSEQKGKLRKYERSIILLT